MDGYLYCGYIEKTGKIAIQPTFGACEEFSEGLGLVLLNGKWHFIDPTGRMILSPPYSQVWSFRNGLAEVDSVDHGKGYIDKTGKIVWPPN